MIISNHDRARIQTSLDKIAEETGAANCTINNTDPWVFINQCFNEYRLRPEQVIQLLEGLGSIDSDNGEFTVTLSFNHTVSVG